MQWLNQVYKSGFSDRNLLIIGGGTSVNDINYDKLPDNIDTMGVNESGIESPIDTDWMIYNDQKFVARILPVIDIPPKTKVIGNAQRPNPRAHYCFGMHELSRCGDSDNTGLKAVMVARLVLKYNEIYLTGFDFYTEDGKSHFFGDEVGNGKKYIDEGDLNQHKGRIKQMPAQFEIIKHWEKIYNCNPKSGLQLFPYRLPYQEEQNGCNKKHSSIS